MEQSVKIIDANDRSIRQILDKVKYSIDVFQREYKWQRKHMEQLINDLTSKFLSNYKENHDREEVANYSKYFLGPMVVCIKGGKRSIIDGQQRLTSLTLLLMYLNNIQKNRDDKVKFDELIFSEKYAKKSFNLDVKDRDKCINSLYKSGDFDATKSGESVKNIVERYHDIEEIFPDDLMKDALPFFTDWLIDNVIFVEIITFSDDDAYTIFETMNDRGLNLTSAEMLKGYLLSNLGNHDEKIKMNESWKQKILSLKEIDKDEDLEFFKAWFRAKHADTIREGKKGSENEDFEKIGTRFHSWVRDNKNKLGLKSKSNFSEFINNDFKFYINLYLKIYKSTSEINKKMESLYFIEERSFARTFYFPILMSPIKITDKENTIIKKLALVSRFLEMFSVYRSINSRTLSYSSIRYTMFKLVKEVRDKNVEELKNILKKKVQDFDEDLSGIMSLGLHSQNKRFIHFLLARITRFIEEKCGIHSNFTDYLNSESAKPFEIEHIWSDNFEEHKDEFEQRDEWVEHRNQIGALILIPRGFNQSYGELSYEKKLPHYFGQNLLAKTLNNRCYDRNPSFLRFINRFNLPFKPYVHFKKNDIIERQMLYKLICEQIYDIEEFDRIAGS